MSEVLFEKSEHIATLTINRPERRNSITAKVVNMLRASLARANHDSDVHAIVLTGSGETVFCAGGDLGREASDSGVMARYSANKELADLFRDMRDLKKPIVARVNGHALGAGFAILLACDLAISVDDIRMGAPELKVGLFPMMTLGFLAQHVGPKRALEFVMTARQISAIDAERLGIVNSAVARGELDAKLEELLQQINAFSPAAIRLGRDAFFSIDQMGFDESLDYLLTQLTLNLQTEDAQEGTEAFLQKRKPVWKGR